MSQYQDLYDVVVVGGGPAGLASAIYAARARYKTLVLEADHIGGQVALTAEVMNYPGVFHTSGATLCDEMVRQAQGFGAEIKIAKVTKVELEPEIKLVHTANGTFRALSVVLATGVTPRILGFEGEKEFKGHGIAYCATCDGEFFSGKDIFVIGGGLAAAEEAMFLTRYGNSVTMIVREEELICPEPIKDKVYAHQPAIKVYTDSVPVAVTGEAMPNRIVFRNTKTDEIIEYKKDDDFIGIFIFSGYLPNTDLVKDQLELDRGYVVTDKNLQTNIPGVYAAGDLCIKSLRQAVTATSDGAIAATAAQAHIMAMHDKLDIPALVEAKAISNNSQVATAKTETTSQDANFIDEAMKPQLQQVFDRIGKPITIVGHVNNSELSKEMRIFIKELAGISENCVPVLKEIADSEIAYLTFQSEDKVYPYRFNGIPGGHEFTSFVLAIYHLAGPKKPLQDELVSSLKALSEDIQLDVVVSLTCTKCPGLVNVITQMMSYTEHISLQVHDLNHNAELKEKYNIMSVPCIIKNHEVVDFGLKDATEMMEFLDK